MRGAIVMLGVSLCAVAGGSTSTGCAATKTCTEIGCSDGFSLTVSRGDGSFPSGMHQVDLAVDGAAWSCSFRFVPPAPGSVFTATSCPFGISVAPKTECAEIRNGEAVSQACTPIPGQFVESIGVPGTPRQLHVKQSLDGVTLLDQSVTPSYRTVRPNGPGCEPACQQATVALTLP